MPGSAHDPDVAVAGGGIVGPGRRARAARAPPAAPGSWSWSAPGAVGTGQTGHASGVVHAGVYYAPGSLKARLCRRGGELLEAFCAEHGVALTRPGKVVVAVRADELRPPGGARAPRPAPTASRACARLGPHALAEVEPHVRGVAALHSPASGVVDFAAVARALAADVAARGRRGAPGPRR